ncbi:uncharacterized protein LOC121726965 isoform X2 [Aricia agestis]|uniref:uncharacterized protein LOC121726965 isoform X2 n=1 Tax=Aricia agestis TaxID=91739 RepID=UPI001C208C77|nr:uncharacterized protein LOC121726965 isoform X2 [Aricia agestis]
MFGNKMNNSGWILCPSKRFPGKFYYYNVVNGESAWCFNETEKKFLSIDDKTRLVSQKWHCYPEPLSPPGKGLNCFTGSSFLLPQKFGQASFPKYFGPAAPKLDGFGAINYVSNARNPSVIKAPILGIQNVHKTLVPKKNVDIQTDLPETEVIVQSCEEPLSKRFLKYHRNESEENNLEVLNGKYFESSKVFKNPTNELQMVQSVELSQENLSLSTPNSVLISTNSTSKMRLADNDLRFILQAKKSEKKKDEPQKKSTVKKVRFDLTPSVNDEESIYDSEDETAIKDAFNTATEKIVKHIDNTAKSDYCIGSKLHIEDDLKNIKFVVKNTNPQNLFQQKADEFNPFQFKSEKITNLEIISKNQNVENSANSVKFIINENQYHTSTPNDSYKNDDILNVTKTMKEKLHVRVPNQFGADPKILFLKSTPQENPFKKYKSKMNPYLKCKSPPKAFKSLPGLFASNRLDKNNFKFPFINSFEHKVVTSNKDINYFDPKLYSNNLNTGHLNNNYINRSGYAKEQTHSGYTNNSKVADGCMIFSDKNKINNKDRWLDQKLKNFYTRNSYIENTVKVRMDEIICSFTQIIENIIYEILEESEEYDLKDGEDALLQLLRDIEEPEYVELPQPTTVSRDGSTEQLNRVNFIKGRSEILQYLRKHFPEWENYCEEQDQTPNKNSTHNVVVTTTGKDLHLYKINSKNQMYREPEDVQETNEFKRDNECDNKNVIAKFHIIEEFENRIKVNPENESTQPKHKQEIIEDVSDDEKLVIDEFYEVDANKCSEESDILIETANEVNITKPDSLRIDTSIRINESSTITDDFPVLINDPVAHISTDDADQYYFLVKTFLTELSNCLLSIHAFIKDNAERMHDTDLTDDDRKEIHKNANQIYVNLRNIILELKSIVERETRNENALKILLMTADGALQDKRITNYRQVTAKCVEQARHLAGCVRLLLRATDHDCTLSASSDAGTTCINIFE